MLLAVPLIFITIALYWKSWQKKWRYVGLCITLGVFLGGNLMVPVLLNPDMPYVKTMSAIPRILTIHQLLALPIGYWAGNWVAICEWFIGYTGIIPFLLFIPACFALRNKREAQILIIWVLFPVLFEAFLLPSVSGRLLVISVVLLLLVSSIWLASRRNAFLTWLSFVVVGFTAILLSFRPLAYYKIVSILPAMSSDVGQYMTGWTSGWGIKEATNFLVRENAKQPIVVFVRFDSGNPEDAVIAAMMRFNIPIFYLSEMKDVGKIPEFSSHPWYFVSRGLQFGNLRDQMRQVILFHKPLGSEFVGVYRILPQ